MRILRGEVKAHRQAAHHIGKKGKGGGGGFEDACHGDETALHSRKLEATECQVGKCEPDPDHSGSNEGMQVKWKDLEQGQAFGVVKWTE